MRHYILTLLAAAAAAAAAAHAAHAALVYFASRPRRSIINSQHVRACKQAKQSQPPFLIFCF